MEINRDNLLNLIKNGLKRDGLSVLGLERDAGVPKDTIRDFLRGKTQVLRADKLQKILRILQPQPKLRVIGHIGAGARIVAATPDAAERDEVEVPSGFDVSDVAAVRIRGDAMLPVFHDGWVIYYSLKGDVEIPFIGGGWQVPYAKSDKNGQDRFAEFLGKPAVIGLKGGKAMIGTLKRGAGGVGYDIVNHNASDLHGTMPEWAAKIVFIKT